MCSQINSEEKIYINFREVVNILKECNVSYWLCQGTLLGVIRDKNLIPWDHDIDLALWSGSISKDRIKEIMSAKNFILKDKFLDQDDQITFTKTGGREVDFNFYEVLTNKKNEKIAFVDWKIPKNKLCKFIEALAAATIYDGNFKKIIKVFSIFQPIFLRIKIFLIKRNLFYQSAGYSHPVKLVEEIINMPFKGLEIKVPKNFDEYLKYIYGDNWIVPKKKYNWIKDSPSTIKRK